MNLTIQSSNIFITKTRKNEIDRIDFALCAQPKDTLENYYQSLTTKPDILINGGFFALSTGETVFDYIDNGQRISSNNTVEYGFGITHAGKLLYGKENEENWTDFVTAYPPLVINGKKQKIAIESSIAGKARRTILGYDDTYIYTISVDNPGITLVEAAELSYNVGCKYAINLDGGGSTRLLYQGKAYATAEWNRPVDNVVAIYTKKGNSININTTTIQEIYRVQVGAFSSKTNADNYCKIIQMLGGIYQNAYVRFVSPYYKVQVGAFSIKENAINMAQDLKAKGCNAFIVPDTITTTVNQPIYTNSPLIQASILSPNNSGKRTHKIDRITPHCIVNQCTLEGAGEWFQQPKTKASCNYCIDKDGRIGLIVNEANRSWCTSNAANDQRAVTIECASDTTDPYRMNDCVYDSLIMLCADICKRNGKNKLIWIPNKDEALAYEPKEKEMLITVHRWFANKVCPGDWLYSRLGSFAKSVTNKLS